MTNQLNTNTQSNSQQQEQAQTASRAGCGELSEQERNERHAERVANYKGRKAGRIERLEDRADRAQQLADAIYKRARSMADAIPLGQPILIGHHSEKRDRNYRARIGNLYDRAARLSEYAKRTARRAASAEGNHAISSDDPNAPDKLADKLAMREKLQKEMKSANAAWRKAGADGLRRIGWPEARVQATVAAIERAYSWEKQPFAPYQLQNNNAEIRRLKKRIAETTAINERAMQDDSTEEHGDVLLIRAYSDNRIRIQFPGKPSPAAIKELKASGFRWAPSVGCWQRQMGGWAEQRAGQVLAFVKAEQES